MGTGWEHAGWGGHLIEGLKAKAPVVATRAVLIQVHSQVLGKVVLRLLEACVFRDLLARSGGRYMQHAVTCTCAL